MSMLLTIELVVFAFGVVTTGVTAIVQLLNKLNTIHALVMQLQTEIAYIKDHQTEQHDEIVALREAVNKHS